LAIEETIISAQNETVSDATIHAWNLPIGIGASFDNWKISSAFHNRFESVADYTRFDELCTLVRAGSTGRGIGPNTGHYLQLDEPDFPRAFKFKKRGWRAGSEKVFFFESMYGVQKRRAEEFENRELFFLEILEQKRLSLRSALQ